jgi:hypothetical protein
MFHVVLTMVGIITSDVLGYNPPHNRHGPEVKERPAKNSGDPKSKQRTDMEKSVNVPRPDNAMRGLRVTRPDATLAIMEGSHIVVT